ncbi:hypothetical protein A3D80_02770 [Candidatus Roizmanbacteria bacterium RIFCSPHIGHO2_02_FULL_40_13b]|nr:MAG: hypothetical protein A3D80_02770 [Candidatus Roizmanbacteria bacterium RIFCSPHIGHO2_02_FULL_40_13b]OGK49273.1 MAG: hypothetical protein A3A56_00600 [Candidatus Roizmanbacteria bacterium RIFCSPLOWO2_01_FULL_40_32]
MSEYSGSEISPTNKLKRHIGRKIATGVIATGLAIGSGSQREINGVSTGVQGENPNPISSIVANPENKKDEFGEGLSDKAHPISQVLVAEAAQMDPTVPISETDLQTRYRTYIHNLPDFQLQIMPEALENEPMFSYIKDHPNSELHIVLLDGPRVNSSLLPGDIDDEDLVARVNHTMENYRQDFEIIKNGNVFQAEDKLRNLSERAKEKGWDPNEVAELEVNLNLYRDYWKKREFSDEEMNWGPLGQAEKTEVARIDPKTGKSYFVERRYVLLPVRNITLSDEEETMRWVSYRISQLFYGHNDRLYDQDSRNKLDPFLDPRKLPVNLKYKDYPIHSSILGTTLRHEAGHAGGLAHPYTDFKVLHDLFDASRRYQRGEAWDPHATDKSGYYFKFVTPEGEFYSQNPKTSSPVARAHDIKGHTGADFKARAAAKARLKT